MIQFKCPKCQTVIKVGDDKAGTVVTCTECPARLKAPSPKKPPARTDPTPVKKKPAPDVDDVLPVDEDEDEAPRKKKPAREVELDDDEDDRPKKGKTKARREDDEDDYDDEDDRPRRKRRKRDDDAPSGKNVVSGIVYIVLGLLVGVVGVVAPQMLELQVNKMIPMIFGPVAGLLIAGLGIFYIVRK